MERNEQSGTALPCLLSRDGHGCYIFYENISSGLKRGRDERFNGIKIKNFRIRLQIGCSPCLSFKIMMHILKELTVIMNKEKNRGVDMSLEEMRNVDIRQVDRSSLADLRDIRVKKDSHNQPDIQDLLKQTANLYMYRVGEIVVAFDYSNNGKTVNDTFALMVQSGM